MGDPPVRRAVDFNINRRSRQLRTLGSSAFIAAKKYNFALIDFDYNKREAEEGEIISAFGTVRNNSVLQGSVYIVLKIFDPIHTASPLFGVLPRIFGLPPKGSVLTSNDVGALAGARGTLMLQEIPSGETRDFSATFQLPKVGENLHVGQNYYTYIELWQPKRQHRATDVGSYSRHLFEISRHRSLGVRLGSSSIIRPPKIFVAYAHDEGMASWYQEFEKQLKNAGCDVWFDLNSLHPGVIEFGIVRGLEGRVIVPVLTSRYMKKWREEQDGVGAEKKLILNAIKNGAAVVPLLFGNIQDVEVYCPEFKPYLSVRMNTDRWQGRPFAELMRKLYLAANPRAVTQLQLG